MKTKIPFHFTVLVIAFVINSCQKETLVSSNATSSNKNSSIIANSASVRVFARNLYNPRGLKFGPDGKLYVAEGGKGGTDSTVGVCTQVVPPIGPYHGSRRGGRISKIGPDGTRTTVLNDLPSSQTSQGAGGFIEGVADIAFLGNDMFALLSGAGCSHGVQSMDNGVLKIMPDGSWKFVANLSAFQQSHPVRNPEPDDFEPDGTWYSMIRVSHDLYALEPNHGE